MYTPHINGREFCSAVEKDDTFTAYEAIEEMIDQLITAWKDEPHDDYDDFLRLCSQLSRAGKNSLREVHEMTYHLGMLSGVVRVLSSLFYSEKVTEEIIKGIDELMQSSGKVTKIVFSLLYSQEKTGKWTSQKELAEKAQTTQQSLSNITRKLVTVRAIEASRSGREVYYHLTAEGKRYYDMSFESKESKTAYLPLCNSELDEEILQLLERLEKKVDAVDEKLENGNRQWISAFFLTNNEKIKPLSEKKTIIGEDESQNTIQPYRENIIGVSAIRS